MPSMQEVLDLGAEVFDGTSIPAELRTVRPSVTSSLRALRIYELANDDVGLRLPVLSYLTTHGLSASLSNNSWEMWLLSFLSTAFSGLAAQIKEQSGGEYTIVRYPAEFIAQVRAADEAVRDEVEVPAVQPILDFPTYTGTYSVDLYNAATIKSVYGYAALLIFQMGKGINDQNKRNFKQSRPQNIIDKYNLTEDEKYFLTGDGRLSDNGIRFVNIAWEASSAGRCAAVHQFSSFRNSRFQSQEIVYFMFRLLENAFMQPAYFIHQLLKAIPETATIALLRPAISLYLQSVVDFAKEPATIRPYFKIIHGDNSKIFHSKSLQDLTACAVLFLGQDNETIRSYNVKGGARAIAAFKALCKTLNIDLVDFNVTTTETALI